MDRTRSPDRLCIGNPGGIVNSLKPTARRSNRSSDPTGLLDPMVHVRSARNQVVDDLYEEIHGRQLRGERILITTLTKRMAEDLTEY